MTQHSYTDAQLQAYLDGGLPPKEAEALEQALATEEALEARLMALDPLVATVRSAFEGLPDAQRMERLQAMLPEPEVPASNRAVAPGWIAAVAACVAAVGFAIWQAQPKPLSWQEQVAIYQALYVAETVAPLDASPDALEAQFARASSALGRALDPADVAELPGLTLKRAQILGLEGQPLIQLAFAAKDGTPVAFCILREDARDSAVETIQIAGLPAAHWSSDGYGYMVIGEIGEAAIADLAGQLSAVF